MQKSKEKNIALEEQRKRTEASLARKRINPALANGAGTDSPASPSTSGAMDSLLEKLRAAAPQARDQRDRRRRARLKERHQIRVASGQKMPTILGMGGTPDEGGEGEASSSNNDSGHLNPQKQEDGNTTSQETQVSESEDVADRAANLLQGLRSNMDMDAKRARRRRESAEDERRARRMRRRNAATNGSKDSADGSLPSSKAPMSPGRTDAAEPEEAAAPSSPPPEHDSPQSQPTPAIVVSPTPDQQPEGETGDGSSPDKLVESAE